MCGLSMQESWEASEVDLVRAVPLDLAFDGGIRLVSYTVEPAVAVPDAWLHLTLYWEATGDPKMRADPYVRVSLVAEDGQQLDTRSFWPNANTSPIVWTADQIVVSRQPLYFPSMGSTGSVMIEIALTDGPDGRTLPVLNPLAYELNSEATVIATLPAVGSLTEVRPEAIVYPRSEQIGNVIGLAGYDLAPWPPEAGRSLIVTLFWQVFSTPPADLTVFVHLLDEQGQLVAQFDGPPGGGSLPTSSWSPGQLWMDSYPILLPHDLPAGQYQIRVGMYTWPDLLRERVYLDGQDMGDSVMLDQFVMP